MICLSQAGKRDRIEAKLEKLSSSPTLNESGSLAYEL